MVDVERNYEFWLLGLPGDNPWKSIEKIKKLTKNICVCFQFYVPQLRIGTLDLLLKASTDLQKLESTVIEVISRIVGAMRDVMTMNRSEMRANLLVKGRPMPHYLHKFQWEGENFPLFLTLKALEELIYKEVSLADAEVKKHLAEYTVVKQNLDLMEKNQKGSLLTRNISHLVKKEDFVHGSQHLVTVVVVVPKASFNEWLNTYELLDDEVVPRSSKLLFEEGDFGLFNVTLFKRRLENFTNKARLLRFFVRDFTYNVEKISSEAEYLEGLRRDKTHLDKPLLRLLKSRFSETYIAMTHVLAARLFVECILRYGLPSKFLYMLVIVSKNEVKKARNLLEKEYAYLEMTPTENESKEKETFKEEYYPYVSFKIRADVSDF